MHSPFQAGGTSHLSVLVLTCMTMAWLIWHRRSSGTPSGLPEKVLKWILILSWPATLFQHWHHGTLDRTNVLPMHFCDWALAASILALHSRHWLAVEVAYFFGLAGTLQGLLTPSLRYDWPHPAFFTFFVVHAGIVVTAVHLVAGMRLLPRPGAVFRMIGLTLLYGVVAAVVNASLGTNYGFLCAKPASGSLLDILGPWPWYVGSLVAVASVLYTLLDLPIMWVRFKSLTSTNLA